MLYEGFNDYKEEMCKLLSNLNKSTTFPFISKEKVFESVWNKEFIIKDKLRSSLTIFVSQLPPGCSKNFIDRIVLVN